MLDIAWTELALVALLILLVVGPKDLPKVLRTLAHYVRKFRRMAGEFQRGVDEMIREAELDDVKKQVDTVGRTNWNRELEKQIDPSGEVERGLRQDLSEARKPVRLSDAETGAKDAKDKSASPAPEDEEGWEEAPAEVIPPDSPRPAPDKGDDGGQGAKP